MWFQNLIAPLRFVVIASALWIVGCVAPGSNTIGRSDTADGELVRALQQRTVWSASGALGIWTEPDETRVPRQNITASVQWAESENALDITLRGPLGIGEMILQANASGARLKRGNTEELGSNPDTLVQQALGLSVPVPFSELSLWMRGLPGQANSVTYDGVGRLQSLRYVDGGGVSWRAQINRYTIADSLQVPEIITATGGPYNIRLVLKRWSFDTVETVNSPVTKGSEGRLRIPRPNS